ncbi:hypothetical protein C8F04DRAFT_694236 [Mycena alexandri]|uniref:Uncharacterized protein n=1 Tax=Mycena alexandri TaxID=1745969 RepID=A0AAD6SQ01_9AGAR|nr:hypothetical protein C8F04DRAFT_694236 [Mycena alexandri]
MFIRISTGRMSFVATPRKVVSYVPLLRLGSGNTDGTNQDPLVRSSRMGILLRLNEERSLASVQCPCEPPRLRVRGLVLVARVAHDALGRGALEPEGQLLVGQVVLGARVEDEVERVVLVAEALAAGNVAYVAKEFGREPLNDRLALDVASGGRVAALEEELIARVARRGGLQQARGRVDLHAVQRAAVRRQLVVELIGGAEGLAVGERRVGAGRDGGLDAAGQGHGEGNDGGGGEAGHCDDVDWRVVECGCECCSDCDYVQRVLYRILVLAPACDPRKKWISNVK